MIKALNNLFTSIESQKKPLIDSKAYILSVKSNNGNKKNKKELFNNEHHHDAHEFMNWLLDNIHETIKKQLKSTSVYLFIIKETFISEIFEGKQSSITKCLNCENVTFERITLDNSKNRNLSSLKC